MRIFLILFCINLFANPKVANIVSGEATIQESSTNMNIHAKDKTIINWDSFSIGAGETTRFYLAKNDHAVLNRVTGDTGSEILGKLSSNGKIYLINPSGILISQNAIIDTAAVLFSTLDTLDDHFLKSGNMTFKGDSQRRIINYGTIKAFDGDVALIGYHIKNKGSISANQGDVLMGAGSEIMLKPLGKERVFIKSEVEEGKKRPFILQDGKIECIKAELKNKGNPYALAIKHSGETKAVGITEKKGRFFLEAIDSQAEISGSIRAEARTDLGDENVMITGGDIQILGHEILIEQGASIDASGIGNGGTILIGGDLHGKNPEIQNASYLRVADSHIDVSSYENGNGGKAILWSDHATGFFGNVSANGGVLGGNGGLVEVSGGYLVLEGNVSTSASCGNCGHFFIDPVDVTISTLANAGIGSFPTPTNMNYIFNMATANVSSVGAMNLQSFLAGNNVTINTSSSTVPFGSPGDITVVAGTTVTWVANELTLTADRDIIVNGVLMATGSGSIAATAARDFNVIPMSPATVQTNTGDISITALNLNVGVGTGMDTSQILTNSGNMSFTIGNDVSMFGGMSMGSFSKIGSTSGAITFTNIGNDLNLTGGSSSTAYAEISSIGGDVTFTTIGNDINITGGTSMEAYAQIGVGMVPASVNIESNLLFPSVVNNVLITCQTGNDAYAQIGHAPFGVGTFRVNQGDISFATPSVTGGITNSLTITGGTGTNTTAIIGHGNEKTTGLTNIKGDITVLAGTGIFLTGNTGSASHAVIGLHSPLGSTGITCAENDCSINVQNVIMNPITLIAGSGSNANIGFYNNAAGSAANITINSINVRSAQNINLTGGDAGGTPSTGIAAIGTLVTSGTAVSGITMNCFNASLLGSPAGNGAARIVNTLPGTNTNFNIAVNAIPGTIDVLGGASAGFADIYSGNQIDLEYIMNLNVNNNTQTGFAHVMAFGDILINNSNLGMTLNLVGGSVATADALIQSLTGGVSIRQGTIIPSVTTFNCGSVGSQASSVIQTNTGDINALFVGNATMQGGGPTANATARLFSNSGAINYTGTNLSLTGGIGNLCFADVASTGGDITINFPQTIGLTGGTGTSSYAQIGVGSTASGTGITSNISLQQSGPLTLTGGSNTDAYAQIGHSPFGIGGVVTVTSNVTLPILGATGAVTLTGGSATGTTAIIGHGNETADQISTCTANVNARSSGAPGNVVLQAGTVPLTHAIIGFHSPTNAAGSPFNVISNLVRAENDNGDILLTATTGSNATVGYYNDSTTNANISITNLQVHTAFNFDEITLQAGNRSGGVGGVASIATFATTGLLSSNITVDVGDVNLLGPAFLTMDNGLARIVNNRVGEMNSMDVTLTPRNLIMHGGRSSSNDSFFVDVYSSNDLLITFEQDIDVNNDSSMFTILQHGYAHIRSYRNMNLVGATGQDITLKGGDRFFAEALIESFTGDITLGSLGTGGTDNVTIGSTISEAPSRIRTGFLVDTLPSVGNASINARQNIALQGGLTSVTVSDTVALIETGIGTFTVSAGQNLTLTGGTMGTMGDHAVAQIRSIRGNGTIQTNTEDIVLTGGSDSFNFAQISSETGSVTFSMIGRDLILNGGSASDAYAQIGIGSILRFPPPTMGPPAPTLITSNLTFSNILRNVALTGGSAANCYAQIGHSPYGGTVPIPVTGNVELSMISGNVTMDGGTSINTTVIIGHGNELTKFLSTCLGQVSLLCQGTGGVTLTPNPIANMTVDMQTHATIGFHSPFDGPDMSVVYQVTSPEVKVQTTQGPITLNGGNENNAIIGYYNGTTPDPMGAAFGVEVTIEDVNVQCSMIESPMNRIDLFAGNAGLVMPVAPTEPLTGVAAIGTFVFNESPIMSQMLTRPNFAISNVNVSGNILNLVGPAAMTPDMMFNNGLARIVNKKPLTFGLIPKRDVTVNMNAFNVRGNLGVPNPGPPVQPAGFAQIYSCEFLTLNYLTNTNTSNLNVDPGSPLTLQGNNAVIESVDDLIVNRNDTTQVPMGDLLIVGGNATGVLTHMTSNLGNILWGGGNFSPQGGRDITVGRADQIGSARIFTTTADIDITIARDLNIDGGSGVTTISGFSEIFSNTNSRILAGRDIGITGGPAPSTAVGRIATANGDNTITARRNITQTGGVGGDSIILVSGFFSSGNISVVATNNVTMNALSFITNGSNGSTYLFAGNNFTMNGDALIQNTGTGPITTKSGVSTFINDSAFMRALGGGDIAVVVDNNFPTPQSGIGPGRLVKSAGSDTLSGGDVRYFTAKRDQNNVLGDVNGTPYVPGPFGLNTATEKWGFYYFVALGGDPFTIFYKETAPNVPCAIIVHTVAMVEWLQNMKSYDDFIYHMHWMDVSMDNPYWQNTPSAFYHIIRRAYENFHLKKIDTLK